MSVLATCAKAAWISKSVWTCPTYRNSKGHPDKFVLTSYNTGHDIFFFFLIVCCGSLLSCFIGPFHGRPLCESVSSHAWFHRPEILGMLTTVQQSRPWVSHDTTFGLVVCANVTDLMQVEVSVTSGRRVVMARSSNCKHVGNLMPVLNDVDFDIDRVWTRQTHLSYEASDHEFIVKEYNNNNSNNKFYCVTYKTACLMARVYSMV